MAQPHWASLEERGSAWGLRALVSILRIAGIPLVRTILYPVVTYYFLTNGLARRASLDYLARIAAFSPRPDLTPSLRTSFRHFMAFATALVDRVGAWVGLYDLDDLRLTGHDALMADVESRRGALLIGAHLGSLEVSRALSRLRPEIRLNVIVHTRHAAKFNRVLQSVSGDAKLELVEATAIGPDVAIRLRKKLSAGELIVITGDRVPIGSDRVSQVAFLGQLADFPQGPFILAALLKCPVYTFFCMKEGSGYHLVCEPFADRIRVDRTNRSKSIDAHVERYVRVLERHCAANPLQWFNFYPFWARRDAPPEPPRE